MVSHGLGYWLTFNGSPWLSACFGAAGTYFAVEESFAISINSRPDPAIVFTTDVSMHFIHISMHFIHFDDVNI
jgi:hypothetical protein